MPVRINGATSGSTTIAAPDTGSDETIVLSTALASKGDYTDWTSYTPTWTTSGAAPTLGNGTLTGSYAIVGNIAFVEITFVWGSTTSSPGGVFWLFSVPTAAPIRTTGVIVQAVGSGRILDSGTRFYQAITATSGQNIIAYAGSLDSEVASTTPMTWATNDSMRLFHIYSTD